VPQQSPVESSRTSKLVCRHPARPPFLHTLSPDLSLCLFLHAPTLPTLSPSNQTAGSCSGYEYAAGHIAGALSIPHDELEGRLRELPKDQEVVAYCRGPYCVFADQAVAVLKGKRRKARRLNAGFPEWKNAGLAVEAAKPGTGQSGSAASPASGRPRAARTRT
jgi:rhodanese-related sulfurtransferase